jgi:hypothetical protein
MEMNKVIVGQKHGWTIIDWIIKGHILLEGVPD